MNVNRVFGAGSLILTGAIVALSASGWVVAAQPSTAPMESVSISQPALEEDSPGWDCATDGNQVCGTPESDYYYYLGDAWASFDGARIAESVGAADAAKAFSVSYVGTYSTEPHWPGCVTVASNTYLGTFHVFYINTGK